MADLVRGQIAYPEPPMPANLVDGSDADDVAVYIALCAANPTCGVKASTTTPPTTTTAPTTTSGRRVADGAGKQVFASRRLRRLPHAEGRRLDRATSARTSTS